VKAYTFIEAEKVPARRACVLLEVSAAAYYRWRKHIPSKHEVRDRELTEKLEKVHAESRGTYGAPRIHRELRKEGIRCGKKRVARLMAEHRLVGRHKRRSKTTTIADPEVKDEMTDLLQREFQPTLFDLDKAWVGDITYIRTHEGWCYLAIVLDLASRRIVGFAMADNMRAGLVCAALRMALALRKPKPGIHFHSDRGSQYTSAEYRKLLGDAGIAQSFSRPRQCWDNAVAESFFGTLKTELIYEDTWATRTAVRRAIFDYIEVFYNRKRIHSSIGYRSPVAYEDFLRSNHAASAA
jgi:putative transposase